MQSNTSSQSPLLQGAILPTLMRLAVPNMLAMVMSAAVAIAETYYIGQIGTLSLAAMALVFPLAMLTQMMSNGAMGSGVSSAISRALGANDPRKAGTLALHALVIGAVVGLLYSLIFVVWGEVFYGWLGGRGEVLAAASNYGAVLFSGAIFVWLCNTLASVVRGTGNMKFPSSVVFGSAILQIAVGGALGLGLGPFPQWGMVGVAIANIVAMATAVIVLLAYLQWGQDKVRVPWRGTPLSWPVFKDILRVGAFACLSPMQSVLAALLLTGMVGRLGPEALAGYGIGQRLEFLLIPLAFGVGVAAVPMVGMAMGAKNSARARKVAWTAGGLSGVIVGSLGLVVFIWPQLWAGIFSTDTEVLAHATLYLRIAGPSFGFFGLGLTLYFASLGAGYVLKPILAGTVRLLVVALVGAWLLGHGHASPEALFGLVAAALFIYGLSSVWAIKSTPWVTQ